MQIIKRMRAKKYRSLLKKIESFEKRNSMSLIGTAHIKEPRELGKYQRPSAAQSNELLAELEIMQHIIGKQY